MILAIFHNIHTGCNMATIRKQVSKRTGHVTYNVQVRLRGFLPQSATFDRLTDARAWAAKVEIGLKDGRHFPSRIAKRTTLAEAIDRYLVEILPTKKDQRMPAERLAFWREKMGSITLSDVTPVAIQNVKAELAGGKIENQRNKGMLRSAATINRYIAALSSVLSACVDWHLIEENPCSKIKRAKESLGRTRFLSPEEEARLLKECKVSRSRELYPAVLLSLRTGARQSEVMWLRWSDVFLDAEGGPFLLFRDTKNGTDRAVPLVEDAVQVLREWRQTQGGERATGLIFPRSLGDGKPICLRKTFNDAVRRAGIEDFSWHTMRHTVGSNLAMSGASMRDLMEILGHRTPAMSKRYSHLTTMHTAGVLARAFGKKLEGDSDEC